MISPNAAYTDDLIDKIPVAAASHDRGREVCYSRLRPPAAWMQALAVTGLSERSDRFGSRVYLSPVPGEDR